MHGERMAIYLQRDMWVDGISFFMYYDTPVRSMTVTAVTGFTTAEIDEAHTIPKAFTLQGTDAQRMMDELWNCGLRPSEGSGSAGQLAAVERHLEDMRALAFRIDPPKPKTNR